MNYTTAVNRVTIGALPLKRDFKRYWVSKFQRIARNSGRSEAERKFKTLKSVVLRYLSDSTRHQHIEDYYGQSGFRTNSYLRRIFLYADCQPHYLLDLLSMYSYSPSRKNIPQFGDPESPHTLAKATHERLAAVSVDDSLPVAMQDWLYVLSLSRSQVKKLYFTLGGYKSSREAELLAELYPRYRTSEIRSRKRKPRGEFIRSHKIMGASFSHYAYHHTLPEWMEYWAKWSSILRRAWTGVSDPDYRSAVEDARRFWPEVYKDYTFKEYKVAKSNLHPEGVARDLGWSKSFDLDYDNLCAMCSQVSRYVSSPLNRDELTFVISFLSPEIQESLLGLLNGEKGWKSLIPELTGPRQMSPKPGSRVYPYEIHRGKFVGHIHHIHKKGAGSDWRDIAVPNRFIQEGLVPLWGRLRMFQKLLPTDSSLDQARFDRKITSRVTNDNLYVGSVDLSKATDNLPFVWAEQLITVLSQKWGWSSELEEKSYRLFQSVARGQWEDQGYLSRWTKGQPLGSIPSFGFLTVTHWLILESLSLACGLGHSPYAIVGDDLVCFNKKLRKRYISTLSSRRIPLSLHKSYDGRLTEFAGKTFVQNCVPFFTTDQAILTWNSLFDYQVATGVRIHWNLLPRSLKRKWSKKHWEMFPSSKVRPSQTYLLARDLLVPNRGSSISRDIPIEDATIQAFEEERYKLQSEKGKHDGETFTGLVQLAGHPVRLLNTKFADKDGYFLRYQEVDLPDWYNDKYRTCSTDVALEAAGVALQSSLTKEQACVD